MPSATSPLSSKVHRRRMNLLVVAVAACAGGSSAFLSHSGTAPARRTPTLAP
eukprot:CAMPEP_0194287364 /NCGR_PEP_ID=MMETSP0169-20130528/34597_1 /TAXON_ID=218684 /ORGANISM="Corethron pennatum, Strain L29A3" /LENGTH=51 /DNA_ID=CAMNT_0039034041 /DNA_START=54 /DNA_END=205 /DNA_ORIENTATION=+